MGLEAAPVIWSGGVHVFLDCACDLAWSMFSEFGGLCKWNPAIAVCDLVEGKSNEPGSVRYCQGTSPDSWVYERLLILDEQKRFCKYRMEENRFKFRDGIQGYVSQIQFRDAGNGETEIDWTYTVEPVATQTYEQFTTFMRGFYLYNLNILQSAVNAAATTATAALESAHQEQQQKPLQPSSATACSCKPIQLRS